MTLLQPRLWCAFAVLSLAIILPGCDSKLTAANYDKVTTGMTRQAVENILGAGTDDTASGTSISSAGIADSKAAAEKTYVWKEGGAVITIIFKDGKVVQKSKTGL